MKKLTFALFAVSFFVASCDKKTTTPPTTTPVVTPSPSPAPGTGDGFLVALQTVTKTTVGGFPVDYTIGTGVAGFGNLAAGTYNDAGAITLESKTLTKNANNSYTFMPSASDPTGIDLSSINWSVGGGNGIPAFTHNASAQGMPTALEIAGTYATISSAGDFTIQTTGSVSNSDSVYFQIAGPSGYVLRRTASNTNSVTFTAAELQTLGKGTGSVVIAPWNWSTITQGGKTIHVINELALSRVVEIQ